MYVQEQEMAITTSQMLGTLKWLKDTNGMLRVKTTT